MSEEKKRKKIFKEVDPEPMEEPVMEETSTEEAEKVTISMEEFEKLKQDLEASMAREKEFSDGWQRERADFINFRKIVERDQEQMKMMLTANVLKRYLGIVDDMERALKNRPADSDGAVWFEGIDLIYRKLQNILEMEGVTRIQVDNDFFDPNIHEAITHEDSPDHQSGQVIEVIQTGYKVGDRVLRPALVRVAR